MDVRGGGDPCARRGEADHHRRSRRWEPAHLRGRAERLPGARRGGDLRRAGCRLRAERDRALRAAQRVVGDAARGSRRRPRSPVGRSSRARRAGVHGHPGVRHMRDGACSVRCSVRFAPSAQPSHPGRRTRTSTDTCSPGVSRFSGVRRPPVDRERHLLTARPEGLHVLDLSAQRLHADSCERRRVARQRRARPHERRHGQQHDDQDERRREAQQSTLSTMPSRYVIAVSRHRRH